MNSSEFFKRIERQLALDLPFVVYRKPKQSFLSTIFQKNDELYALKNYDEVGFIFSPFDSSKPTLLLKPDERIHLANFSHQNRALRASKAHNGEIGDKQRYLELVHKSLSEIKNGTFEKVVLSRKVEMVTQTSAIVLFQRLLSLYKNALCYLWYHPKVGLWLGATPEILVEVQGRKLTTMSLAGTQSFMGDPNPKWGKKELKEQELVTTFIVDALSDKIDRLAIGNIESVRAGNLMHLRTKITGSQKAGLGNILGALHPTPAVCGLPLSASRSFILNHENYNREFYTGYAGELNMNSEMQSATVTSSKNKSTLFVNLRCMQLKDNVAHIYVGGGITESSVPEKEWEETVSKSDTIARIL